MRQVLINSDPSDGDDEIVALEAAIRDAQLSADVAQLDALISPDLLFTGPDGQLGTKAQDLEAHGSGVVRFVEHGPSRRPRRPRPSPTSTPLAAAPIGRISCSALRQSAA